ncbi:cytochrome P450 [Lactarius hatsudake]|nr:cytochrome P450 [Lactarius hatsudake]
MSTTTDWEDHSTGNRRQLMRERIPKQTNISYKPNFVKPYAARFTLNAATAPGVNGAEGGQVIAIIDKDGFCFRHLALQKARLKSPYLENVPTRAKGSGLPSYWKVFIRGVIDHVPPSLLDTMIYLPTSGLAFLRRHVQLSNDIVQKLTIKVTRNGRWKDALSQVGIMNSLISTLLGAGYETAGTSLGWILFELATYPDEQHQLREDVYAARAAYPSEDAGIIHLGTLLMRRSCTSLSADLLQAGNVINGLQIPRGTHLIISDIAYHRNKEIWGEDADVWRPIRWDRQDHRTPGQRGSVGEFVTESQTFLFELIAGSHRRCYVDPQGDVLSMVESEERKGNQLPLKVSLISLDDDGKFQMVRVRCPMHSLHLTTVLPVDSCGAEIEPSSETKRSVMRIFDVYEHPSFEIDNADRATAQAIIRRLGVGATVSALAAISLWGYYWSDPSSNQPELSAAGPTGARSNPTFTLAKWRILKEYGPDPIHI